MIYASDRCDPPGTREALEPRNRIRVSNNGSPFPADIDILYSESLGLQLITSLVSQLDGTIELTRNPLPLYTLRLPLAGGPKGQNSSERVLLAIMMPCCQLFSKP